ncbi:MAG: thymidine kinase [Mollicutes bacterium]|nr:MAG: thymidine kinase [Mollicutes bacterium]
MYQTFHQGFIELIVGCMFAGKTEELIRRISVLRRAGKNVLVFKPNFDNRKDQALVYSHSSNSVSAIFIQNPDDVTKIIADSKVKIDALAFDEVQFFPPEFCSFIEKLANQGYRIICAGLDRGFNDEMFITMMRLLSMAEFVTKLNAICILCGEPATKTQRINEKKEPIGPDEVQNVIGGSDVYQARCRKCFKYFSQKQAIFC